MKTIVYTDGATHETNPGPGGAGAVFLSADGRMLGGNICEPLGWVTNNVAEYQAVVLAIEKWMLEIADDADGETFELEVRTDSALIVNQYAGEYGVKSTHLRPFYERVSALRALIESAEGKLTITYVPREKNKLADKLSKEAASLATQE